MQQQHCIMQQQYIMQRQALIQRLEADQRMIQTSTMPSSHQIPCASNPNSTNVGNLPRIYQPTAPQSDVTSMILDVMTSEDGSSRLQRLLLGQDVLVDPIYLISYITRDGRILTIAAKDEYGIESVKVFVDFVKQCPCMFNWVTSALEGNVVELMMHPIASKLILYCLGTLSYRQKLFIFDAATKKCLKLGKSAIGKVILEECIKSSRDSQQRKILDRLVYHASTLSKTSKGNLVIQFALKIGDCQFDREICRVLKNQLEDLSTDENGSYVIEACLKSSAVSCVKSEKPNNGFIGIVQCPQP
ncbi:uncharacterized protein A4U43_C09F10470 [Asparagus officinalis]|uniref:PUM-HD domain-containing protein n=1 Tax=Asparagus officinalis TaxID=4686 RepID=A0A5P1E6K4_ASPOF|nr:uncharacterized protein A4U43_C09F10470 [Asparagus officinalis]